MIKQYNITDYIKDDPELQKAVIEEFLNDIARLEEENKRLNHLLDTKCQSEWERENERLREYISELEDDNDHFQGLYQNEHCDNLKYRKALEEIRVICKQGCNNCKHNKDDITCSYGDCGEGKIILIEEVINEVLKEE